MTTGGEQKQRANWGSHVEFILTLVGFAVGLGNVWRFPYLCFRNGGGAFLIPYFVCLVVMGIPLFYLELSFGQFASLGPVKIWIVNPAMKGLGYSMIIVSALISLYYNVIIAVCIYYFFGSMRSTLLWTSCDPEWASCQCRDSTMNNSDPNPWNSTRPDCLNYTFDEEKVTNPSEEYFFNRVLHQTSGLDVTGGISWELTLCLLMTWLIVFLVLTKGIKTLGKVVYVTAIFPYVLLTALLIRGTTLDGHLDGIKFYLTPDIERLTDAKVWSDAAVQIFYSLSACSGGLIAMASYNNFKNNVLRDTFLVPIINCLTSFYAGFVIFASLGFMANRKGVSVEDVAVGGPGLAFIAYPEALAQMPAAPVWAVLFFLMMMMLGFSSSFSIVETVLTGVLDDFPSITKSKFKTVLFRAGYCVVGFILGLPMVTGCGFHLLDLVDNATGGFPLLFVGFFEVTAIAYIYGILKFRKDILMMLGDTPLLRTITKFSFVYFGPMWVIFTPACLLAVIVFKCIQYTTKHEEDPVVFPKWADAIWWLIVLAPLVCIPVWFLAEFFRKGGWRVLYEVNSPKKQWGPSLKENRTGTYGDFEMSTAPAYPAYNNYNAYIENNGLPLPTDSEKMKETNSDGGYVSSKGDYDSEGKIENGVAYDNDGYSSEKF